jgi:hypothetical protein
MSKRKRARRTDLAVANETRASVSAFTFGDPEPVNSRATMLDMLECWHNQRWYEPPISLEGLALVPRLAPPFERDHPQAQHAGVQPRSHAPARAGLAGMCRTIWSSGTPMQEVRNRLGQLLRSTMRWPSPGAGWSRQFWWVPGFRNEVAFEPGTVHQIMALDINQESMACPSISRRCNRPCSTRTPPCSAAAISRTAATRLYPLRNRGLRRWRRGRCARRSSARRDRATSATSVHAPDGKESGIRILPIAEVGAKDEFLGIKNTTRDDVLAAHRVPPQLLGIVPAKRLWRRDQGHRRLLRTGDRRSRQCSSN